MLSTFTCFVVTQGNVSFPPTYFNIFSSGFFVISKKFNPKIIELTVAWKMMKEDKVISCHQQKFLIKNLLKEKIIHEITYPLQCLSHHFLCLSHGWNCLFVQRLETCWHRSIDPRNLFTFSNTLNTLQFFFFCFLFKFYCRISCFDFRPFVSFNQR